MGNNFGIINYNNFICNNYYCNSISLKPEWFSESSWSISYNISNKPYFIDKGNLIIGNKNNTSNIPIFKLILSKKLLIEDFNSFSIPINFKYFLNEIEIFIIFSNKIINLDNIIDIDNSNHIFYIKLHIKNNHINISRSFDKKNTKKKIKNKKNNTFIIELEKKNNVILINETFYSKLKKIYNEKYIKFNNYEINTNLESNIDSTSSTASLPASSTASASASDIFLSLFIKTNNHLNSKEYIELNFE